MRMSQAEIGRKLFAVEEMPQGALPCYITYYPPNSRPYQMACIDEMHQLSDHTMEDAMRMTEAPVKSNLTNEMLSKWYKFFGHSEPQYQIVSDGVDFFEQIGVPNCIVEGKEIDVPVFEDQGSAPVSFGRRKFSRSPVPDVHDLMMLAVKSSDNQPNDGGDAFTAEPHKCNCSMQTLMRTGCQCGGI